jgi:hypothetical protein
MPSLQFPAWLSELPFLLVEGRGSPLRTACSICSQLSGGHSKTSLSAAAIQGKVTISGSSAGGTSCLFLMGTAEAEGLLHKAIIHISGGIRNIQALDEAEAAGG